eukprot:978296-Rhodomonas_salina.3
MVLSAYALGMECPVMTQSVVLCDVRYSPTMSGTDRAYGATHLLCDVRVNTPSCYANATECPVLTRRMALHPYALAMRSGTEIAYTPTRLSGTSYQSVCTPFRSVDAARSKTKTQTRNASCTRALGWDFAVGLSTLRNQSDISRIVLERRFVFCAWLRSVVPAYPPAMPCPILSYGAHWYQAAGADINAAMNSSFFEVSSTARRNQMPFPGTVHHKRLLFVHFWWTALRNQTPQPAFLVQIGLATWLVVFDFAVWAWPAVRKPRILGPNLQAPVWTSGPSCAEIFGFPLVISACVRLPGGASGGFGSSRGGARERRGVCACAVRV